MEDDRREVEARNLDRAAILHLGANLRRGNAGKRLSVEAHRSPRVSVDSVNARAASRPLGYSPYLTAHSDARILSLYMPSSRDGRSSVSRRGLVKKLSRKARKRLLEKVHTVRRDSALPQFYTLTFPDFFPTQRDAKRVLDTWFKRVKRAFPSVAMIWRMEVIDRKSGENRGQVAPHFHLLVWGNLPRDWAARAWWEVNGKSDYALCAHLEHGTKEEVLESWGGAVFYCAKYCAKVDDTFATEGRTWGVHNKAAMPVDRAPRRLVLTLPQAFRYQRIIRRFVKSQTGRRRCSPRTVFTSDPLKWWEAVR